MDRIRDLLQDSQSRLSSEDRQAIVTLLWLLEQAPESAQKDATSRIEPWLDDPETERDDFLREVRALNSSLRQKVLTRVPRRDV